jgi:hypothetical protein
MQWWGAAVTSDDGLAPTIVTTAKELKFQNLRGLFTKSTKRRKKREQKPRRREKRTG